MTDDPLPQRQAEVAHLVGHGDTNKQIAAKLHISVRRISRIIDTIGQRWRLDITKDLRVQIALRLAEQRNRQRAA